MKKKLYFLLSDGNEVSKLTMELDDCMEFIKTDLDGVSEDEVKEFEYTLIPTYLTDDEFNALPEYEF